jgi:hypothetical protein
MNYSLNTLERQRSRGRPHTNRGHAVDALDRYSYFTRIEHPRAIRAKSDNVSNVSSLLVLKTSFGRFCHELPGFFVMTAVRRRPFMRPDSSRLSLREDT